MKSIKEYLCRVGKSKGFGIQSPWAYSFVKDVITEQLPYYAYEEMEEHYSGEELKRKKLYFRVRNFIKRDELHVFDLNKIPLSYIESFLEEEPDCVAFVVEGMFANENTLDEWRRIKELKSVGVTFDLYDFAICFLASDLYKQHYKLNF